MEAKSFYLTSNDLITQKNIRYNKKLDSSVFVGVSNIHSLHVLSLLLDFESPRKVFFYDANSDQVDHLRKTILKIQISKDRLEFLESFYVMRISPAVSGRLSRIAAVAEAPSDVCRFDYSSIESDFWSEIEFDGNKFYSHYGVKAVKCAQGLKVESRTVGDVDFYYSTLFPTNRNNYATHSFPLGWGYGFLRDEKSFLNLKRFLSTVDVMYDVGHAETYIESKIISNRYSTVYLWTSNIFTEYFKYKFLGLREAQERIYDIASRVEPRFPEVELVHLFDYREKDNQKKLHRKFRWFGYFSNHTLSFSTVNSQLIGRTLEVVNQSQWIVEDNNIPKLENASYCLFENFLSCMESNGRFDTIFFHMLVSHGEDYDKVRSAIHLVLRTGTRLIILEHNNDLRKFRNKGVGLSLIKFKRDFSGFSFKVLFCNGKRDKKRNLLLVFN